MSFGGDLRTFDVFDLVGWLMGRRRAGILQMTRRSTRKRLAFRDGQLQWSSSNDPRETIGQALVRDGLIGEEVLFRALLKQEKDKRRLGEILIGDGLLTEPQLMQTLRGNAEAHLYELFLWADGRFDFDDEKPPQPEASDLQIDMKLMLEEGRHRREQWHKLRSRFTSNEITFRLTADPVQVIDPQQRQVLDLAAWGKTLAGISLESRRSEFETTLLVAQLVDQGLLAVDRVETGAPETDPSGSSSRCWPVRDMRLKEGRYDAADEAYERVLGLDGLNQAAKKGLLAVAASRREGQDRQEDPARQDPDGCGSPPSRCRSSSSTRRRASCSRGSTGSGTCNRSSSCARCPRTTRSSSSRACSTAR